jgi:hypothetical protein
MTTQLPADLPSFDGHLAPRDEGPAQALRTHMRESLLAATAVTAGAATPAGIEATLLAVAACAACGGHCCRNGKDTAYLDAADLARVRRSVSHRTDDALVAAYVAAVPVEAYAGSCIFHTAHDCNLPREMRSQVCLRYLCWPLRDMFAAGAAAREGQ